MSEREFWLMVRRSLLQLVKDLTKDRPGGRYTLEVTLKERVTIGVD